MIATLKAEEASQHQLQVVEREDINDEEDLFEAIDKLISAGINTGGVRKLQKAGIYTCNGLMMHTKKHLTGIKGLSEAKVDNICKAAEKIVLAHTLCVSTQLPTSMKGGNGKVAYIDTEGTFRPDGVLPIAERFGMHPGAVLDNIIYARAYTYEHQYNLLLVWLADVCVSSYLQIVDSVIAVFRVDFTWRGELAERQVNSEELISFRTSDPFLVLVLFHDMNHIHFNIHLRQKLAQMLSRLTKIAEEFNVAVYMTKQVIADPGGGVFISDPKKPAGGHVLAHAATIRLMFRKGKGEQLVCKLFDAPNLPEAEKHIFQITPGRIADAKD
ncbi:hypothetical protein SLE2022_169770 [Rubroshorea leprosula]